MHEPDPTVLRLAANMVATKTPLACESVAQAADLVSLATKAADSFRDELLSVVVDKIEQLERDEPSFAKTSKLREERRRVHPRMKFYATPATFTLDAKGVVAPFAADFRATSQRLADFLANDGPEDNRSPLYAQVVDEIGGIVWASLIEAFVASSQPSRHVPSQVDACKSAPSF